MQCNAMQCNICLHGWMHGCMDVVSPSQNAKQQLLPTAFSHQELPDLIAQGLPVSHRLYSPVIFPLVNVYITTENHHLLWKNSEGNTLRWTFAHFIPFIDDSSAILNCKLAIFQRYVTVPDCNFYMGVDGSFMANPRNLHLWMLNLL